MEIGKKGKIYIGSWEKCGYKWKMRSMIRYSLGEMWSEIERGT